MLRKRPQCGCPTPYRTPGQSTRSTVRAPAPSSPIASSRRIFIRSFKSFASAQRWRLHQRGWAEPCRPRGRGATRRSPQREGIRQHPAPPDPPHRILGPLRSSQMKHARGGGPAIVQQAPSMRAPCSHTPAAPSNTSKRSVRGLFFAHFLLKKRPKNRLRYVTARQ